jgi:hypothetical protein
LDSAAGGPAITIPSAMSAKPSRRSVTEGRQLSMLRQMDEEMRLLHRMVSESSERRRAASRMLKPAKAIRRKRDAKETGK